MDFPAFTRPKSVLLWRAHVTTKSWGHSLEEVLKPMIEASAPLLGMETARPAIIAASAEPIGHVIVGTPQVKDYPLESDRPRN